MGLMVMAHEEDPRSKLVRDVGDVSHIKLTGNKVLVAIYRRPDKTATGIYLSDKSKDEDKYQGKVGLILQLGPQAFVNDDKTRFSGATGFGTAQVGDWVIFKTSETWPLDINSRDGHCRMIDDIDIRAVISQPDKVW